MATYDFKPSGVCSNLMQIDLDGDAIGSVRIHGGCDGNLKAICKLVEGQKVEDVIDQLSGITCGRKPTSCADQLARALREALSEQGGPDAVAS